MARSGLGQEQRTAQLKPEKPEARPPDLTDKREPNRGKDPEPEKAFREALRAFVKYVGGQKETSSTERIGGRQAIVLLIFSVDIALVYAQFSHWLQGLQDLVYQELLKVVPWMLGATAVGYGDRVRQFLLKQAHHWKVATVAAVLPVPLLIVHLPIFSFKVRVPSEAFRVNPDDTRVDPVKEGNGLYRLVFPSLDAYRITVTGPEEKKDYWVPFPMTVGRMRLLRATLAGTLAHIPLVGRAFRQQELPLGPLYNVPTESDKDAEVQVEGQFQEGFFQEGSLKNAACRPADRTVAGRKAAKCPVAAGGGGFSLPKGHYDFTLTRDADGCSYRWPNYEVKALVDVTNPKNELIDFDKLCSKHK